jgi:hypothetical protein
MPEVGADLAPLHSITFFVKSSRIMETQEVTSAEWQSVEGGSDKCIEKHLLKDEVIGAAVGLLVGGIAGGIIGINVGLGVGLGTCAS